MIRRLLIVLVCLCLAGGLGWGVYRRVAAPVPADTARDHLPVPVVTALSAQRDVPVYLDGLGTVQAFNAVTVRSMIDGPLIEVRFREGQDVKAGDVLAMIDPRPYQASLDQAMAKKAQDEANLANARIDLQRYNKLVAQDSTSGQTAATQRATVAQDEALVRQDQAAIDTAQTNLSYTSILAPLAGRTGIRQVDNGNIVHITDSNGLVVITQLQPISVVFSLPQQDLGLVSAAMAAGPTTVVALPQGGATVLDRGVVAVLDNQIDSTTGTIKLKATFPNKKLTLWPGGFLNVRLLAETLQNVVTLPPVAVQRGPTGTYVYVIAGDKARRQAVTIGHEDAQVAVVTEGLPANETVVVDGASRLQDGSAVMVTNPPPMAERPKGGADGAS